MKLIKFSVILLAAALPFSAYAKCTSYTSDGRDYYIVTVRGFNPPPFNPNDTPIGGIIYKASNLQPTYTNQKWPTSPGSKCDGGLRVYQSGYGTPDSKKVYPTNIPNIGIRMYDRDGGAFPIDYGFTNVGDFWWQDSTIPRTIELIKTGNITEGGVLSGAYARSTNGSAAGELLIEFRFEQPILVTPKAPTCTVTTPRIPVQMTTSTTAFTGVGATASARNFSIGLACSGGLTGTAVNAYVTLTDATTPGNRSTTLSLTPDSKASGVGIQILKDNVALAYGPDSSALDNPNRWWAGRVKQGESGLVIPLQARYVQTEPRITPGAANANASFTMSYQ